MIMQDTAEDVVRYRGVLEADASERRRRTAYHEAGHTAMLFFLGKSFEVNLVDMVENQKSLGRVMHRAPLRPLLIRAGAHSPSQLCRAFARIECRAGLMFSMAGLAAENAAERFPEFFEDWFDLAWEWEEWEPSLPLPPTPTTDMEQASALAQALYGSKGNRWYRFLRQSAQMAEEAITTPRLWKAVDALAKVLICVDVLEADAADNILSAAWGEAGPVRPYQQLGRKWRRRLSAGPLYV